MKIWTATDCAKQYLGMKEVPGHKANPAILAMLKMDMIPCRGAQALPTGWHGTWGCSAPAVCAPVRG